MLRSLVKYIVILISLVNFFPLQGWDNLYSNLTSLTFCLNQTATQDNQDTQSFEYQEYKLVNVSLPFQLITTPYQGSVAINVSDLAVAIPYFHFKFGRKYSLIFPSIYLPTYLSIYLSIYLFIYLFIYLCSTVHYRIVWHYIHCGYYS